MEPCNNIIYDYTDILRRIDKLELSFAEFNTYIKSLDSKVNKSEHSPFMRVVNAICNTVGFLLKPITWLVSLSIIERDIKPFIGEVKIPKPLNSSPKT